jgi:hypothetical protein
MDPALLTAIATFFTALNGWTVGTVILCIFVVPPILALVAALKFVGVVLSLKDEIRAKNEQDNRRFEAMVAMFNKQHAEFSIKYDNNVYLVKNWEKTAADMTNLVYLNTQAMTSLGNKFDQIISIWTSDRNGRKQ